MLKHTSDRFEKIAVQCIAVALCLALILFLMFAGVSHYDTNDDVTLNNIAVGNYGEQNRSYLVFSNICYGSFITLLYNIADGINWYAVFPIALAILSLLMLTVLLVDRAPNPVGVLLTLAVIYIFGESVLVNVQFTHFAGFFSSIGLFFMFAGLLEDEPKYKVYTWSGLVLAFMGFCLRLDAFLAVAAIIGVCCLTKIILRKFWKLKMRQIIAQAFPFVLLFALIGVATLYNNFVYESDPDWHYWVEYNTLRANLLDYPIPSFSEYADRYLEIGIDELDLQMLCSWNYGDREKFSLDTMKQLCQLQQEFFTDTHSNLITVVVTFVKDVFASFEFNRGFLLVAALSAGLAFWRRKNLWIIFPAAVLLVELFYLSFNGRFIYRTYFGMWLALSLVIFFTLADAWADSTQQYDGWHIKPGSSRIPQELAATLAFLVFVSPWLYDVRNTGRETKVWLSAEEGKWTWRQELSQDEDTLYIHETLFGGTPDSLAVFEPVQEFNHNIYCMGGWTNPSPLQEYLLEKHGVAECGVVQGLLSEDKNVYYLELKTTNFRERFLAYLRKEYSPNVQIEQVNSVQNANVYRFFIDDYYTETNSDRIEEVYHLSEAVSSDNIQCSLRLERTDETIQIHGWSYISSIDSYKQNVWLRIKDGNEQVYLRGMKWAVTELAVNMDDVHAPAAGIRFSFDASLLEKMENPTFEIIIEGEGQMVVSDVSGVVEK